MSRYRVQPPAQRDIREATRYIAVNSPRAAAKLRRRLRETFTQLARQPGLGRRRADLTANPQARFRRVDPYLVVYRVHPTLGLQILRVLHGSRDVAGLLEEGLPED